MAEVVVVTGTSTEVGKTHVAAALARAAADAGARICARKPVQSFERGHRTDAEVLAAATGQEPNDVCPAHRWYPVPMAPPLAAEALGRPAFTIADLVAETDIPAHGLCLVEGVGGPRSPLASDGDTVSLADALEATSVLLVADAALGAINAVRLSAAAFGDRPLVVYLNRFDPTDEVAASNLAWLTDTDGFRVITRAEDWYQVHPQPERGLEDA